MAFAQGSGRGGFWQVAWGGHDHLLVYLLAWESVEERQRRFGAFRADPERQRVFAESERNGRIVERVSNLLMNPTGFSPMQ